MTKESQGIHFLTDFWKQTYFNEYIRDGGSKIKFVTGRPGSGKTHFLKIISKDAEDLGYKTIRLSAKEVWMHDFRELYIEILRQSNLLECLEKVSHLLIQEMGFSPEDIPAGMKFIDYLSQSDLNDALTKREIRTQLKQFFLNNPLLDNNFALACSMLTGSILGYPILEEQNKELLLAWLEGDRTVKLSQLRSLGFYPNRITKYNARHMLRSLAEIIHMGGCAGLLITVDNLEILINKSSLEPLHYTKTKREDTYESIRQLIDEIDTMKHMMFVFAFDRCLMDEENTGLKSYQALWMRIQSEVVGERFNRFADIADLDRLAAQEYTPEIIVDISKCLTGKHQSRPLSLKEAEDILNQIRNSSVGVPQLIQKAMQEVVPDV